MGLKKEIIKYAKNLAKNEENLIFRHRNKKIQFQERSPQMFLETQQQKYIKSIESRNHTKIRRFTLLFFPKMLIKNWMRWGDWAAVGLIQSSDKLHFSNINKEIEVLKDILKLNLNTLITSKGDFFTSWKISSYYIVKSHHKKYVLWKYIPR